MALLLRLEILNTPNSKHFSQHNNMSEAQDPSAPVEAVAADNDHEAVEEVEATPAVNREQMLAGLLNNPLVMNAVQQKVRYAPS